MTQGRKPLPTQLKIVKGTAQKCRINKNEPKPKSDAVRMPDDLTPEAKQQWRRVCKRLKDAQILTNLDIDALAMYCEAYAQWRYATTQCSEQGAVVETDYGVKRNPHLMVAQKAFDQMRSMLTEFGMTPSSRTKISIVSHDDDEKDPWSMV